MAPPRGALRFFERRGGDQLITQPSPHGEGPRMLTVLLVEDHASFREALQAVIAMEDDLAVVAHVDRGERAGALAAEHVPNVAVVDLDLPGADGIAAIRDIRRASPGTACLVLTALKDDVEMGRAVVAGAAGVLHKSIEI
ncbi:MAG: response regulator transcription factor, partial [Actinomycetota bacterium]|nr:response regulator transcription factor [Actinomycetota bacterium]